MTDKQFYTAQELADIFGYNVMTIYRYINAGKLKAYKIGKEYRVSKEDFDSFLNKLKTDKDTNKELTVNEPAKNFEGIKKISKQGIEYWEARELMPLLGYDRWENFQKVIDRAKTACAGSKQDTKYHFLDATKMIKIAKNTPKEAPRNVKDYYLSRYACYLVAQNGDPRKQAIATAQTYFAVQTRKQELSAQITDDQKRLYIRQEVKKHNVKLFETAQQVGVNNFGKFNNYGYLGLYGLVANDIKKKKQIGKDDILDRAGATELAANLFRITQTDDQIKNKNIQGEEQANSTHYSVGKEVRTTIEKIGGTMPEDLQPEKHIKEIEKAERKMLKNKKTNKKSRPANAGRKKMFTPHP